MPHVVIADAEPDINYIFQVMVTSLGGTSDAVATGVEALELVERVIPDLVIADDELPGMSGIDLLREIKSNPRLSHISVVIASVMGRDAEARAAGCDGYLRKPWTLSIAELFGFLRQFMAEEPSNEQSPG